MCVCVCVSFVGGNPLVVGFKGKPTGKPRNPFGEVQPNKLTETSRCVSTWPSSSAPRAGKAGKKKQTIGSSLGCCRSPSQKFSFLLVEKKYESKKLKSDPTQ